MEAKPAPIPAVANPDSTIAVMVQRRTAPSARTREFTAPSMASPFR
ncbi:hypothetical protein IG195_20690 (plasmid) [Arthrobacter sp. TES]|nr:hypothetical protein [Paenarthrobacter ureafaciens]AOY74141.1 hypothetical protein ARZXY2_4642 [Arthrobacter sp. ZXY-2]QOI65781.1 hypothetical protein IG195_20690 [Arthrobacter sp. TES]